MQADRDREGATRSSQDYVLPAEPRKSSASPRVLIRAPCYILAPHERLTLEPRTGEILCHQNATDHREPGVQSFEPDFAEWRQARCAWAQLIRRVYEVDPPHATLHGGNEIPSPDKLEVLLAR